MKKAVQQILLIALLALAFVQYAPLFSHTTMDISTHMQMEECADATCEVAPVNMDCIDHCIAAATVFNEETIVPIVALFVVLLTAAAFISATPSTARSGRPPNTPRFSNRYLFETVRLVE